MRALLIIQDNYNVALYYNHKYYELTENIFNNYYPYTDYEEKLIYQSILYNIKLLEDTYYTYTIGENSYILSELLSKLILALILYVASIEKAEITEVLAIIPAESSTDMRFLIASAIKQNNLGLLGVVTETKALFDCYKQKDIIIINPLNIKYIALENNNDYTFLKNIRTRFLWNEEREGLLDSCIDDISYDHYSFFRNILHSNLEIIKNIDQLEKMNDLLEDLISNWCISDSVLVLNQLPIKLEVKNKKVLNVGANELFESYEILHQKILANAPIREIVHYKKIQHDIKVFTYEKKDSFYLSGSYLARSKTLPLIERNVVRLKNNLSNLFSFQTGDYRLETPFLADFYFTPSCSQEASSLYYIDFSISSEMIINVVIRHYETLDVLFSYESKTLSGIINDDQYETQNLDCYFLVDELKEKMTELYTHLRGHTKDKTQKHIVNLETAMQDKDFDFMQRVFESAYNDYRKWKNDVEV